MSQARRLAGVGLALPDYDGRSLGAVLPASLAAVGAADAVTARDAEADRIRLGLPMSKHVIVVLVDGMGLHQLEARKGHAPFLRSIGSGALTAGYPTTTSTSLTLFGTGHGAGMTGMAGYTVRNPRTGGLANLISWDGAEEPLEWQPMPSLLETLAERDVSVTTFGKHKFAGSGLSKAAFRGGTFVGADKLADRTAGALRTCKLPGITYVYWGELDAAGHRHGWQSEDWVAALEEADAALKDLARSLPKDVTMVVTADHGMVDIAGAPRWDVAGHPDLSRDVTLIGGEPRAVHVYAEPGKAEAVADAWGSVLGSSAVPMLRQDAIDTGLFGPVSPAVVERIGDVVVPMAGRATVVDSRTQTPQSLGLLGVHGSLTPEELEVPLLLA